MWHKAEQFVFSLWLSGLPPTKWHGYWLDGLLGYCTDKRKKAEAGRSMNMGSYEEVRAELQARINQYSARIAELDLEIERLEAEIAEKGKALERLNASASKPATVNNYYYTYNCNCAANAKAVGLMVEEDILKAAEKFDRGMSLLKFSLSKEEPESKELDNGR